MILLPVAGDGVEVVDIGEAIWQTKRGAMKAEDVGALVEVVVEAIFVVAGGLQRRTCMHSESSRMILTVRRAVTTNKGVQ